MKPMQVSLEVSDHDAEELLKFIHFKKLCSDLHPMLNPVDRMALRVLAQIQFHRQRQEAKND